MLRSLVVVTVSAVLGSACGGPAGDAARGAAGGGEIPVGTAPLVTGEAASPLPGDECDPTKDGWMPEPIVPTREEQAQIDQGRAVLVKTPPGYEWKAPVGVATCESYGPAMGIWQVECRTDVDCPKGSVCPPLEENGGFCVVPCERDEDCKPPRAWCVRDRLTIPYCGCWDPSCISGPPSSPDAP